MTSDPRPPARQAASRRNGARSRGPTTATGKVHSCKNPLRHGFPTARTDLSPADRPSLPLPLPNEPEKAASDNGLVSGGGHKALTKAGRSRWRGPGGDREERAGLGF
jgi:hypothetical protein